MRRLRVLDPSAVATAVLAAAVFVVAVLAIAGVAVRAADGPASEGGTVGGIPIGDDWTGFHLEAETHSGTLFPGGLVNYLVSYENLGPVTATVRITDTLPTGTEFVRAWWGDGDQPNAGEDLPPPVVSTGFLVAWELPPLGSRQPRWFHVEVAVPVGGSPNLTNCVAIAPASDETTVSDNLTCVPLTLNSVGPNLAVAKASQWQLPDMDHLIYEIRYWNWGNGLGTNVPITDTLPAGTQLVSVWTSDPNANCSPTGETITTTCTVPQLAPGAAGRIWLDVALDQPPGPMQSFTNTVEIATPAGDVAPADNAFGDVASTGGEVREVAFTVATERSSMLVFTPLVEATEWITVTTPAGQFTAHPDPVCRCAELPDIGPVWPGDTLVVAAGEASQPVTMTVPAPFEATADAALDYVQGQIGWALQGEPVEVILHGGPVRLAPTSSGSFGVAFPDVPPGGTGEVRHHTAQDFADVIFRRFFYTDDLVLNVHSRDNWVEGPFELGHTVWLTVTDAAGGFKASSQLQTWSPPWWGGLSGFTTQVDGAWTPEPPDIVPGDWIFGELDSGITAEVRVGTITGELDFASDVISGTIEAPWLGGTLLAGECVIAQEGGPARAFSGVDPNGGSYSCDFSGEWDLQPGDQVLVRYWQPSGHSVMNQFSAAQPELGVEKHGEGAAAGGANFEYVIAFWNEGTVAAENTFLTDTLPVGSAYITSTLAITPTVSGQTVAFDLGTVEPGVAIDFALFATVPVTATVAVTNTVEIDASNVITVTVPPAAWVVPVQANSTDLTIVASPTDPEPMPDSDLGWDLEVCNAGLTSSATAAVTAAMPADIAILTWWADQAGWVETSMTGHQVVLERPTVPGSRCLQLHVLTHVVPDAPPGQQLCSQFAVEATGDVNPANNSNEVCVTVGGAAPAVEIQKRTNGQDADDPPGPYIVAGSPVEWLYEVTNTGNVALEAIVVEDDQPGVIPFCPGTTLAPGASMACEAAGLAVEGPYANLGTVSAVPTTGGDPVTASDPSHYFGAVLELGFEKTTNGQGADDPPGPQIPVGAPVQWAYQVINASNVALNQVVVEDDQPGVVPVCPTDTLGPGEAMTCEAAGIAVEGQYANIGTATATPPGGLDPLTASDPSHYLGVIPELPFEDGFESGDTSAWSETVP